MYSGESKAAGPSPITANGPDTGQTSQNPNDVSSNLDSGPALEVIELANGETIWFVFFPFIRKRLFQPLAGPL